MMLVVIQQVTFNTRIDEALGKIIFESVPFSLGVALSNQLLQDSKDDSSAESGPPALSERFMPEGSLNETIADIGATLVGAIIIAFDIAPTDEVNVLVASIHGPWLIFMVLISYSIVFPSQLHSSRAATLTRRAVSASD